MTKLELARRRKNLTQKELGRKVGISQAYVSNLEHRAQKPGIDTLLLLGRVLEMDACLLLSEA